MRGEGAGARPTSPRHELHVAPDVSPGAGTVSSTRLFVAALDSSTSQRYLIGYPSFLLYSVFVLMTVF